MQSSTVRREPLISFSLMSLRTELLKQSYKTGVVHGSRAAAVTKPAMCIE